MNPRRRPSAIETSFYLGRVYVRLPGRVLYGYFADCIGYFAGGQLTVLVSRHRDRQLRRPFAVIDLDPPAIEIDDPQNYDGFIPRPPMAA